METTEKRTTPAKLPVIDTLREATETVVNRWREIILVILLPLIVDSILWVVYYLYFVPLRRQWVGWVAWFVSICGAMLFAFAAVACHRLVLIGPGSVPKLGSNGTRIQEWRYLTKCLVMALILLVAVVLFVTGLQDSLTALDRSKDQYTITNPIFIPMFAIFALIFSQLSLVLPAVATDRSLTFSDTFRLAKGNAWRLAILIFGVPFIVNLAFSTMDGRSFGIFGVLVKLLLKWIIFPFEVVILSLCYKHLIGAQRGRVQS